MAEPSENLSPRERLALALEVARLERLGGRQAGRGPGADGPELGR
jgi:hypothetical protein